ncbi:MAG: Rrf2 family transcriptional regulator, partial [Deltaproteobacteria bacterium]|nr:Rrf2 family transcriptional regulator [Deltaproteobacteria bacterium]
LTYIRNKGEGELTSAREIADRFDLPFEILAKTLQRLKDQGVIASTYGTRGGYILSRDLIKLSLGEFLKMMEGPVAVVACTHPDAVHQDCGYHGHCNIKSMMSQLNSRFYDFLDRISVEEITRTPLDHSTEPGNASSYPAAAFQGGEP